ncbi:Hsp70 family protein [Halorubrum sp. Atlit-26R]|uniref:Hsp70 family protein n=1 Tax=Halorubrum sp. Atlit-26R TaxID=2282128 RepID=UPI000EF1C3E9|nr:Hsp70 family protein [Halorubrum sp. Atlit-26R]RLM75956.1 molecular chaperone DnaK [Halorubrum sp. Atlit-26R]
MSSRYKPVGIDLGTTRSALATVINEEPELVENMEGEYLTPSVVQIDESTEAIVGSEAANSAAQYPERTVREIKRKMGDQEPLRIDGEEYLPEEISALTLKKVVNDAEARLDRTISNAVITVPAYFGEAERSATKSAGDIAGLEIDRLLPEPSAACLAYGYQKGKLGEGGDELVFVYDLGGGTFDASLVEVDYDINFYETKQTDGINSLGGKDWTETIADWITHKAENESDQDPTESPEVMERINKAAREAKHTLSSKSETKISIPFLLEGYNFEAELAREEFNEMSKELIERTREPMDRLFETSEYDPEEVDTVLLIGGSSRMKQVHEFVENYFGQAPSQEISPDRSVARGAAIQAGILADEVDVGVAENGETGVGAADIIDVVPKTLGVELNDGRMSPVIETNEAMPVETRKEQYSTIRDDQTTVRFPIREGESEMAEDNDLIGDVVLGKNKPIPPRDPSETSLAVTFIFDKDGTLEVEAEDLLSGNSIDAVFEGVGRHSESNVEEMRSTLPTVKD